MRVSFVPTFQVTSATNTINTLLVKNTKTERQEWRTLTVSYEADIKPSFLLTNMESSRCKEEEKPEANDIFRSFVAHLDDSVWRTDVAHNGNSEVKLALTLERWYKLSEERWKKNSTAFPKETSIVDGLDILWSEQIAMDSAWPLKPVDDMAQNVYDFVNSESTYSKERDFAGISLGIAGTSLSHAFDLDAFATQVYDVFQTYYDKQEASEYLGPYFVFVQSSGTGKTKILYEYVRKVKSEQSDKRKASSETKIADDAKLVLCQARKGGERGLKEGSVFDCFYRLSGSDRWYGRLHSSCGKKFSKAERTPEWCQKSWPVTCAYV